MKARKSGLHFFGWGFGICLSILFASLWGRAVVIDTETLGESLAPMARSNLVVGFLTDWMAEEMIEGGVEASLVDPAVDYFISSSQVGGTLDRLAIEVVAAAASPDPAGSAIDMRGLVAPAIPEVTAGLNDVGIAVTEAQVTEVAEGLDPLEIREPGSEAMVGPNSGTATHLGTASLLSMVGLMVFGTGYLAVSDDRTLALRSLVTRIAVGGLSFGLLLRIGSWVLDPDGGKAPLRETLSAIAGSKWIVPFQLGLVAAVIAVSIYMAVRLVRGRTSARASQIPRRSKVR